MVVLVIHSEQASILLTSSSEDVEQAKRHLETHARAAIPLFRGSNLSMFLRKRPNGLLPDGLIYRRQNVRSSMNDDTANPDEINESINQLQRRFDEYSENPGPMFG